MKRRELLKAVVVGGAGVAALPAWIARLAEVAVAQTHRPSHVAAAWTPAVFTSRQNETVIALCELIIPHTETAGAKAARVNEFIDTVLADADAKDREAFLRGLAWIDARSRERHGADFVSLAPGDQTALLTAVSDSGPAAPADRPGAEFFKGLKALTITGYYTSRIGMLEELGDDGRMVFADYVGCTHPEHGGA